VIVGGGYIGGRLPRGSRALELFGTPTLIFEGELAAYLKFTAVAPSPHEAAEVFDALLCLARLDPELVEIKFPHRP